MTTRHSTGGPTTILTASQRQTLSNDSQSSRNEDHISNRTIPMIVNGSAVRNDPITNQLNDLLSEFGQQQSPEEDPSITPAPSGPKDGGFVPNRSTPTTPQREERLDRIINRIRNDPIYTFLQQVVAITKNNIKDILTDESEIQLIDSRQPSLRVLTIQTDDAKKLMRQFGLNKQEEREKERNEEEEEEDEEVELVQPSKGWNNVRLEPTKDTNKRRVAIDFLGVDDEEDAKHKRKKTMQDLIDEIRRSRGDLSPLAKKNKANAKNQMVDLNLIDSGARGSILNSAYLVLDKMKLTGKGLKAQDLITCELTRSWFGMFCGHRMNVELMNSGRVRVQDIIYLSNMTAALSFAAKLVSTVDYSDSQGTFVLKKKR
jgi:hypothetical protein